jgi:hypothetical protein
MPHGKGTPFGEITQITPIHAAGLAAFEPRGEVSPSAEGLTRQTDRRVNAVFAKKTITSGNLNADKYIWEAFSKGLGL